MGLRLQGHIVQVLDDAIALLVARRFISGVTFDTTGFGIALLTISGGFITLGLLMDAAVDRKRDGRSWMGRFGTGLLVGLVWIVVAPAVADAPTPHFNVRGFSSYVVLVVLMILVAQTTYRLLVLTHRTSGSRRD